MPREFPPTPAIRPVGHAQFRDELGQPTLPPSSASGSAGLSPPIMKLPYKPPRGLQNSRIYSAGDNDATTCVVEPEESPPSSRSELEAPLPDLNRTQSSHSSSLPRQGNEVYLSSASSSAYSSSTSGLSSDDESRQGFRAAVTRRWNHGVKHMQEQMQDHLHRREGRRRPPPAEPPVVRDVKHDHIFDSLRTAAHSDFQRGPELMPNMADRGATYSPNTNAVYAGNAMELSRVLKSTKADGETSHAPSLHPSTPFNDVERGPIFKAPSARKQSELVPERKRSPVGVGLPAYERFAPRRNRSRRKAERLRHELSAPSVEIIEEDDRGRQKLPYIKDLTAKGQLTVAEGPRKPGRSRTSSGRRSSWRGPHLGVTPVLEEEELTALPSYRSWREGSGYSHAQTVSEMCRSDVFSA